MDSPHDGYAVVIGFDPGGTTGWCAMEYHPGDPSQHPTILGAGQCDTWKMVPFLFGIYAGLGQPTAPPNAKELVCVTEDFRLYKKEGPSLVGDQFIAPQVIGVIRFIAEQVKVPIVLRPASNKSFFDVAEVYEDGHTDPRRLLTLDYIPEEFRRHPHKWRHVLDAINHTLHYLHFDKKIAYR